MKQTILDLRIYDWLALPIRKFEQKFRKIVKLLSIGIKGLVYLVFSKPKIYRQIEPGRHERIDDYYRPPPGVLIR